MGKDARAVSSPPARSAGRGRRKLSEYRGAPIVLGTIGVAVTILAFQAASKLGLISEHIPPIFTILRSLATIVTEGEFWSLAWKTMWQVLLGLAIAAGIAIPCGLAIGSSMTAWRAVRPTVEFLRPVPAVALIPVTILLYGNGVKSAVILIAFGTLWALLLQAIYGRREVDPIAMETARSFQLGFVDRYRHLIIPTALPFLATGMRLIASGALMLAIVTEMVTGATGLGNAIILEQNAGNFNEMYALIVAAGLLGLVLNVSLAKIEDRLLSWHPSRREVS
ncbi:MAG: ABC transporter permease [Solirubrobacterales bacterium]